MGALIESVFGPAAGWWLSAEIFGLIAFPLGWRFFGHFPDRGWSLAKPFGILLTGYLFWLGASFRLFSPARGALVLLIVAIVVASLFALGGGARGGPDGWKSFFRSVDWRFVGVGEAVFLVGLLGIAVVRAYNPEVAGTEKPMELTFLNAVLKADSFPPRDPWLSGFTVSYYYFGYVLIAMFARLTGTVPAVAFNLGISLIFGLTAQAIYGVVGALGTIRGAVRTADVAQTLPAAWRAPVSGLLIFGGLFGAFALLLSGNLVGILDFLYSHGFGNDAFWRSVSIDGFKQAYESTTWYPTEHWWWWKATRVINTFVNGQGIDYTITEFPAFSFILADLHPHVLALPFDMLVVGLALSFFTAPKRFDFDRVRREPLDVVLVGVVVGSLGFLNSWDLPAYAFIVFAAVLLRRYRELGSLDLEWVKDCLAFAIPVGAISIVAYVPFYLRFQSQASGIRPVLNVGSSPEHFLLIWGPLLLVVLGVALVVFFSPGRKSIGPALVPGITIGFFPLLAWTLIWLPSAVRDGSLSAALETLPGKLAVALPLAIGIALFWLLLLTARRRNDVFAMLLCATAALLLLGAELFYIVDVFNSRMNTVFKFYFQGWAILSIVAGYGLYRIWPKRRFAFGRVGLALLGTVVVGVSGYYAVAGFYSKAEAFLGDPTLDGLAYARLANPEEAKAIEWLDATSEKSSVVVEATGGQYSEFGRVATRTGLPTLLGWAGHERQWRGSDKDYAGRDQVIDKIYSGGSREEILALLRQYQVTYVFVGSLERQKYGLAVTDRLAGVLEVAYQNPSATVFKVGRA